MAENSTIQWTSHTLNPWRGCSKVHAGCLHCYAETNYSVKMHGVKWGPNGTRVRLSDAGWKEPLKWDKQAAYAAIDHEYETNLGKDLGIYQRPRVFCASLADVFEDWKGIVLNHEGRELWRRECGSIVAGCDDCPKADCGCESGMPLKLDDMRRDLFALIDATPNLDWLLLTKRPENIGRMWPAAGTGKDPGAVDYLHRDNVWLGTSVSDQATADEWGPKLNELSDLCPITFLSIEPLIGPITIPPQCLWAGSGVKWVIVGGESGPGARPCNIRWIAEIVGQCQAAGVPVFVKQLGAKPVNNYGEQLRYEDKKGGDIETWPSDLRFRQFPTVQHV